MLLAVVLLVFAGSGIARATENLVLRLPAPTGPYRVGMTELHLVDGGRNDPWDPTLKTRELMVSVFYPAAETRGYPVAPQMTRGAAELFKDFDAVYAHPELPKDGVDWAATMTHAHLGAPAEPVRRPVLLYSPALADPRTLGTSLAEDLASRGYVVVTMDHAGETSEVEFPGGRVRRIGLTSDPTKDPQAFRAIVATRIADTRFVLDQLEVLASGRNPDAEARKLPANLGRALDMRRVGMYGHSAGGTTAAETMYEDRRIDAAINLEGYLDYWVDDPFQPGELLPIAQHGVNRPLLLFGTDGYRNARYESSWSAMLAHPHGRTCRRQLDNAMHWVFSDFASEAPQLQAAGLMTAEGRNTLIGAIDPAESVPAVHDEVASFFARHLPR